MPLTHLQLDILESAWEILDKLRNCKDFNDSHDLTISDGCSLISDYLDWHQDQERKANRKQATVMHFARFESFQNL
ncbi:hypothetical protein [Scytonema sp. PCC 10023]|uniref:hypothetical protein n=1 Tax=Scytonema sp. PCC 10023 TaxID=1680591 RepID=UPI0039C60185